MTPLRPPFDTIDRHGTARPWDGGCRRPVTVPRAARPLHVHRPGTGKRLASLDAAFDACAVRDGATLSFHHHLRNGDQVLNRVLDAAARRGLRGLTVAASSLFPVHAPLVGHVEAGVVERIVTAYMSGPVADAVSAGRLREPVLMQTHGGRAAAIETGRLPIDVAFIAAPVADEGGNVSGASGRAACGPLGYAMVDAAHAERVVAVTDCLQPYPVGAIDIPQTQVDFVVVVDSIGDPAGILSGTTRPTRDPLGLQIADTAARVIEAAGLLGPDFSFQTGAGGISLAVAQVVAARMRERGVQGSFAAGGVTGTLCEMLEAGLFRQILDVQCFDLQAVESYRRDPRHLAMSAAMYASPLGRGAVVDRLQAMILGAAEVDLDFNVNVTTGTDGRILGGSGGHADTADGAALAIVTTRLAASAAPKIVERVRCVTTPGSTIDVVVTELGVAVNPARAELAARLRDAGLPLRDIHELRAEAARRAASPPSPRDDGPVVAVVEYRDGRVIDVVRRTVEPAA